VSTSNFTSAFAFLGLCLVLLASGATYAMPADGSEGLIREGLALRRNGDDEAALERFTRAARIRRSGRVLTQIALAEQALGRWVEAESHLIEALSLREEAWIAKNRPLLDSALADISSHLGTLEVVGNVPGAEVRVNGTARGRLPLPQALRVASGTVTVEVDAQGYFPLARTVTVMARGRSREVLTLVPSAVAPTASVLPPTASPSRVEVPTPSLSDRSPQSIQMPSPWQRQAGIAAFVASAALMVYGGISTWQREKLVSDNSGKCTRDPQASESMSCSGVRKSISKYETGQLIGYGGAAALAVTGGVLLWVAPSTSDGELSSASIFMRGRF